MVFFRMGVPDLTMKLQGDAENAWIEKSRGLKNKKRYNFFHQIFLQMYSNTDSNIAWPSP
jgi:hypothetical protein